MKGMTIAVKNQWNIRLNAHAAKWPLGDPHLQHVVIGIDDRELSKGVRTSGASVTMRIELDFAAENPVDTDCVCDHNGHSQKGNDEHDSMGGRG